MRAPLARPSIIVRHFSLASSSGPGAVDSSADLFDATAESSSSDAAAAAAAADAEADASSPSTANSFRSFVRSRSAGLAARAARDRSDLSGVQKEWRDSARMRAMKQEASGGVIRHTRASIRPGRMDEFLEWAASNLANAYTHEGFKGAYLTVNQEESQSRRTTTHKQAHTVFFALSPLFSSLLHRPWWLNIFLCCTFWTFARRSYRPSCAVADRPHSLPPFASRRPFVTSVSVIRAAGATQTTDECNEQRRCAAVVVWSTRVIWNETQLSRISSSPRGSCFTNALWRVFWLLAPSLLVSVLAPTPDSVENLTFWTSEHAMNSNGLLPAYRSTMSHLRSFCVDAPEVELKQVALEIKGASRTAPATESAEASHAPSKTSPQSIESREKASGVDYSY
jgi:hypothetical protein